jgi:hypothetical protein
MAQIRPAASSYSPAVEGLSRLPDRRSMESAVDPSQKGPIIPQTTPSRADIGPARPSSGSPLKVRFLKMPNRRSSMNRLWDWIKKQIVQDVPEHLEACEFDCRCVFECRKNQCTSGERETRERPPYGAVRFIVVPSPHSRSKGRAL